MSTKTPADLASEAIVAELTARLYPFVFADPGLVASFTTIISQACADACAEERERVALAFETESAAPEMRTHAKCLRASAAFVRALGPTMIRHACPHCDGCEVASLRDLPRKCQAHEPAIVDPPRTAAAERADVAAYLRGLLPAGVDDLARFIERGDHVGAGKAKGE